jgi:hypothetical protein
MFQKVLDIVQIVIMGISMLLIMAILALIVIGRFKMAQQCLSQF